jgi:hypothetical protein
MATSDPVTVEVGDNSEALSMAPIEALIAEAGLASKDVRLIVVQPYEVTFHCYQRDQDGNLHQWPNGLVAGYTVRRPLDK